MTGARALLTDASCWWSWVAYIGQSTGYALQAQVAGEHEIGDVLIVGAGEALARPMPSPWDLRSTSLSAQQLIAVCGRSAASSWEDSELDAYATARLATGLLADLWDVPFGVVQDPRHVRNPGQDGKPERPIAFPTTDEKLDDDGLEVTDLSMLPEFTVPAEVASSWAKLIGSEDLRRAVIAFQEGLSRLERHTSYASLAFVAIIESLATGPVKNRVECKQVTGSTARFRDALAPLIGTDAARLLARMCDKRSRTAHDGSFTDSSCCQRWASRRFLSDDPVFDFRQEVEFLRFACKIRLRELLAMPSHPRPALHPHAADVSLG